MSRHKIVWLFLYVDQTGGRLEQTGWTGHRVEYGMAWRSEGVKGESCPVRYR